jgi:LmbE family N-acetylglucosaminyl deacetylase
MTRVLVISPHPDDEAIGCGGVIRQHALGGHVVRVVFLTSGEAGGHGRAPEETARLREDEAQAAARILEIEGIEFWREPDGALSSGPSLTGRLRETILDWGPQILYVPHDREDHPDHRAAARLVRQALSIAGPGVHTLTVLQYEVWTPLSRFDRVVDISPHMEVKLAAIRAHKTQCAVMDFGEAALGLNRYRAIMHSGWPPASYAEVFASLRPTGDTS